MSEPPITLKALAEALLARATTPPRIALTRSEAAAAIGVSVDSFERYVQPALRVIREGRLVLVPTAELERWVRERAAPTLPGATGERPTR